MWKNKTIIDVGVKQKIMYSEILSDAEKDNFLRHIAYFTLEEQEEFLHMI